MENSRPLAHEVLARLGLSAESVEAAVPAGVANHTWLCGEWVVRLSKDPEYLDDLWTESVAVPAAVKSGVRTPEAIHFSLRPDGLLPPYSVFRRVQGLSLSQHQALDHPDQFFRLLGEQLNKVHRITEVPDPENYLDEAWALEENELRHVASGLGLSSEVDKLLPALRDAGVVFVHQDLHADNVLVDQDEQPVLIDWGDAAFGDPASDFRFIPVPYLMLALEGYRPVSQSLLARIALHQVEQWQYEQSQRRHYGPYGSNELESLVGWVRAVASRVT